MLQLIGHNGLWIQTVFNHIKIVSHISNPNSAWILQKDVYIEFENVLRQFPQKKGFLNSRFFVEHCLWSIFIFTQI